MHQEQDINTARADWCTYDWMSSCVRGQDEELIELFGDGKGSAGSVTAVRVVRDARTSVGKGIAFVEFAGRPAARMAMAADGRVLRGRPIRVTRVAKSGPAAAAESAAAGGSRLRTPFSRGAKSYSLRRP